MTIHRTHVMKYDFVSHTAYFIICTWVATSCTDRRRRLLSHSPPTSFSDRWTLWWYCLDTDLSWHSHRSSWSCSFLLLESLTSFFRSFFLKKKFFFFSFWLLSIIAYTCTVSLSRITYRSRLHLMSDLTTSMILSYARNIVWLNVRSHDVDINYRNHDILHVLRQMSSCHSAQNHDIAWNLRLYRVFRYVRISTSRCHV